MFSEASLSSKKSIQDRYTVRCLCDIHLLASLPIIQNPRLPFLHLKQTKFEAGSIGQSFASPAYASHQPYWPLTSSESHVSLPYSWLNRKQAEARGGNDFLKTTSFS